MRTTAIMVEQSAQPTPEETKINTYDAQAAAPMQNGYTINPEKRSNPEGMKDIPNRKPNKSK